MGLYSGNTNEKRLVSTVADKPYSSLGGFHVFSLSPLATFGKRLAEHCHSPYRKLAFCNVSSCRTFVDISSFVCFWLVFSLTYRTFGLGRGEYTKQTYCGKIRNMLLLFLSSKVSKSDILSESRVPPRRKFGTATIA